MSLITQSSVLSIFEYHRMFLFQVSLTDVDETVRMKFFFQWRKRSEGRGTTLSSRHLQRKDDFVRDEFFHSMFSDERVVNCELHRSAKCSSPSTLESVARRQTTDQRTEEKNTSRDIRQQTTRTVPRVG